MAGVIYYALQCQTSTGPILSATRDSNRCSWFRTRRYNTTHDAWPRVPLGARVILLLHCKTGWGFPRASETLLQKLQRAEARAKPRAYPKSRRDGTFDSLHVQLHKERVPTSAPPVSPPQTKITWEPKIAHAPKDCSRELGTSWAHCCT